MRPSLKLSVLGVTAATVAASLAIAPLAHAAAPGAPSGVTWAVDRSHNALIEYADGAHGAAVPIATISGAATGLEQPSAVVLTPAGDLYVTNAGNDSITKYAFDATGNAAPLLTISGSHTDLAGPSSIALSAGEIWVTDPASNLVEAFSTGSTGNVYPAETVFGPKTGLDHPVALTTSDELDGTLWVANAPTSGTPSLDLYFLERPGNIKPAASIYGSHTGLVSPSAIFSPDGIDVFVTDASTDSVSTFEPSLGHNTAPDNVIAGAATGLDDPTGMSFDAIGDLAVSNGGNQTVSTFRPTAAGDQAPVRTISGVGTQAGSPSGVAIHSVAPGAPRDVHVAVGNGKVHLTWKAPAAGEGGPLAAYIALAIPKSGGLNSFLRALTSFVVTRKTSATLTHLHNGTKYEIFVAAENAAGAGVAHPLPRITPIGRAQAPDAFAALPGEHSVSLYWQKPTNNGGDRITGYRVSYADCSLTAKGCHAHVVTVPRTARHATIGGLVTGTTYHVRVRAVTKFGNGAASRVLKATAH